MSDPAQLLVDHLDIWTGAIERKSGSGRGNGGKISLYGIDKLRSLILDLAVRGKLVPQDPADGDAGELLKQIRTQKHELLKRGAIKKSKILNWSEATNSFDDLPPGWAIATLGSIATKLTDGSHNPPPNAGDGYPMLSSQNVFDGRIDIDSPSRWVSEADFVTENARTDVKPGDVLLTIVASIGRSAVVPADIAKFTLQRSVAVISTGLYPRFLSTQLHAPFCSSYMWANAKGTAQKGIYLGQLSLMPLLIPPLAEQKRIVAKVDELMALVDALEAGTRAGMASHETLVRELLATLVNSQDLGDLARNWSRIEAHFDTLFTTEESIDALKQTIIDLGLRGKLCIQDQTEDNANQTKLRADKDAENFDLDAFEKRALIFALPQGWTIEPLSRVSSNIVDCPHTTPKWTDDGEICVKSEQIFAGFLDLTSPNFVSEDTYIERIERLEPKADDILYKREGGILGIGARIPHGKRVCLGQRLMLIRANDAVLPAFLELAINSPWLRDFAREKTTGGAAPRVNMSIVRAYPVPIPPIREQERILQRVDELFQLCERASKAIADSADLKTKLSDAFTSSAA